MVFIQQRVSPTIKQFHASAIFLEDGEKGRTLRPRPTLKHARRLRVGFKIYNEMYYIV